jgi:hypothetical protein
MALRFTTVCAVALLLAACGERETPDASPYAGGAEASDAAGSEEMAAAAPAAQAGEGGEDGLSELDRITRAACEAASAGEDDGFADGLPDGAAFASRAADGRVHTAWTVDGSVETRILRPSQMETEARRAVDRAVADFLRHNMRREDDRTGRTGAFRARDGRFCILQTEPDVVAALRTAALAAPEPAEPAGESEG